MGEIAGKDGITENSSSETTSNMSEKPESSSCGSGHTSCSCHNSQSHSSEALNDILLDLSPSLVTWRNVYDELMERGTEPRHKTGLRELDEMLWGMHKRELMTIGARTSHGKSALALQIASELADTGQKVVYFSLEMSKEQLIERLFSNVCRVDNRLLRRGLAKDQINKNKDWFENHLSEVKLLVDDKYGYSFDRIVEVCEVTKPDFVFVDYIQMISTKGYRSKVDAIEEFVRKLKELANNNNFGAVLISQINRAGEEGATMANLKWAGVLEEHSDSVLLLNWDYENSKYDVVVSKQRHGEVGTLKLTFVPENFRFTSYVPVLTRGYEKD